MITQKISDISQRSWFFAAFVVLLFVLNLFQSYFTELLHDEAYYWYLSRDLSWGYFHNPPAIAIFTGIGYKLFANELGVRLVSSLSCSLSVYMIYCMLKPSKPLLLVAIILSITPIMIGGFLASLDAPLIFFACCFLWVYKQYLERDGFGLALLLGVCMSAMLYTKYHGILAIFFILLSNLSLLKRKTFYVASVFGALLFLPHLWWEYQNDFATFYFHIFDRSPEPYSVEHSLHYIGSQILMAGVPAGLLLLFAAFRQRSEDMFQRGLNFVLWGIYAFFLVSSLKGHTEANWTAINFIPLTMLSYQYLSSETVWRKWLYRLLPLSILSIMLVRVLMVSDSLAYSLHLNTEIHHWKEWANELAAKAEGKPVVFINSYQKASKYIFYSGNEALSLNNVMGSRNHWNFIETEENLQGRQVYFVSHWGIIPKNTISQKEETIPHDTYTGCVVNDFRTWMNVKIVTDKPTYTAKSTDDYFTIRYKASIPDVYKTRDASKAFISYQLISDKRLPYSDSVTAVSLKDALTKEDNLLQVKVPKYKGQYSLFVSVVNDGFPPYINSRRLKLVVSDK